MAAAMAARIPAVTRTTASESISGMGRSSVDRPGPTRAERHNLGPDGGFIQFLIDSHAQVIMGKVIAFGETAVGLGLIFGAFVGVAAVGGAFMNLNFMLAGSASTNPVMLLLGFLLVLAWKTAGYIGLDRFLMPLLGTPWKAPKIDVKATTRVPVIA